MSRLPSRYAALVLPFHSGRRGGTVDSAYHTPFAIHHGGKPRHHCFIAAKATEAPGRHPRPQFHAGCDANSVATRTIASPQEEREAGNPCPFHFSFSSGETVFAGHILRLKTRPMRDDPSRFTGPGPEDVSAFVEPNRARGTLAPGIHAMPGRVPLSTDR